MITVPQSPWRFRGAPAGVEPRIGYRGQDNREVLQQVLGLSVSELDDLETEAIISSRPPRWARESS